MAVTSSYLVAVGKLGELLAAIRNAQAPERFTTKFLEGLGYKSTNDRLFIGLLKALGFLDGNGTPQQRYFDYLDESRSKSVLADGLQVAYEDLFRLNKNAHQFTLEQVKGKLKSLTQGQVSYTVLKNMARTFVELVKHADFDSAPAPSLPTLSSEDLSGVDISAETSPEGKGAASTHGRKPARLIDSLAYRIEVVLPSTRDKATYDAIFRSLKEHLL